MARKPNADFAAWPALTLEGNLIAPAMVSAVVAARPTDRDDASYGLRKGLTLRDEISLAFRVGQAHFDAFAKLDTPSLTATTRYLHAMLAETFGFTDLTADQHPVALTAGQGRIPLVIVPPSDAIDKRSPSLSLERARSAAFALQDHLNARDDALWGLATNGHLIRLMRDNASLTRPAYIEANLAQIFATEDMASFSALWLLIHRSRFGNSTTDCPLEHWRDTGAKQGEVARDKLAKQVEQALKTLGSGFLQANPDLRARLQSGQLPLTDWFNELLRLVYRLIFLMVAEDRALLHPPTADPDALHLYQEGYSLTHLRAQSLRRAAWDRHHDRFEGVKVVFRALSQGQPLLALPALGGLFTATQIPDLDLARLPNRNLMAAIYHLSYLKSASAIHPVNWRAMETEELGSVYESLLELQPQLDGTNLIFATDAAETKGNQRKTTGSYYTPDSLVQALLDTALTPVLDQCEGADDPAEALLNLSVIDPACGSGHFLLAAARRIAARVAKHRAHGTPSNADFRHALRETARRCLHGVDRNPMAVELTKVALWIETVDPGLPLGFFDAQIRCGDALLGVFDLKALDQGIPDAAYKPLAGDDKATAKYYATANRTAKSGQGSFDFTGGKSRLPAMRPLAADYTGFRALTEDSLDAIDAKSLRFASLRQGQTFHKYEMACDLYTAAFLLPKTQGEPTSRGARMVPTSEDVWQALDNGQVWGPLIGRATIARTARALHWPLEFPDVFAKGGFDVVLGNPPWERIKLQEQEFFAARAPAIANAANKAARERAITALRDAAEGTPDRALFTEFQTAKRVAEATSEFVRTPAEDGGRFPLTGRGDVNTYALFAEHFSRLTGPKGRAGVIVPTGIATDATTAPFFAALVANKRLSQLVDFENRAGLFPAVDSRMKFALLTLGHNEGTARFAFFLTDPSQLAEPERNFTLTPAQIAKLNPNTKTAPVFRSRMDAELTARIYDAAPVLVKDEQPKESNLWGVELHSRIWHMAEDAEWFRTVSQLTTEGFTREGANWSRVGFNPPSPPEIYVPLYEAKMFHHFDHRWTQYSDDGASAVELTLDEKQNVSAEPQSRYWVSSAEVEKRLSDRRWPSGWLLGWRDITNATNERTVIFSVVPRVAVGHTSPLLFPRSSLTQVPGFLANLAALTFDYAARQSVGGTHLSFGHLKQLPILPPTYYTPERLAFLTPRVLELTYTSHALAPFARDLGHTGPPFAWDDARRASLRAELDAFFARAYNLTRDDLRYILDPADVMGPTYPSETFRVLKDKETRLYGEYRTRRLVLSAWDAMAEDGTFKAMGM
ncbi:MAG: N-6 DNA methylase [Pseudomonadota bacterium]